MGVMAQATALRRPPAPAPSVAPVGEFLGTAVDRERRRGRGTLSNASGRYEPTARIAFDDGWQSIEELPSFETTVTVETARKIITRNDSPDIGFDRSINPYRGCEHGCPYCMSGDTLILMADGRTRPLSEIRVGDEIYGTRRSGFYRRYTKTRVLAHWSSIKPAY